MSMPLGASAPASSVALNCGDHATGFLSIAERHQYLVQHNIVQYLESCLAQPFGEAFGQAAVTLNQFPQAATSERSQRCPQFDSSGSSRCFRCIETRFPTSAGFEVGCAYGHSVAQVLRIANHGDSGIVGNVEPFVAVDCPGVGIADACEKLPVKRGSGSPQSEGTIHMNPGTSLACARTNLFSGIECSSVDVSGLDTNDSAIVEWGKRFRSHAALIVSGNRGHTGTAKAVKFAIVVPVTNPAPQGAGRPKRSTSHSNTISSIFAATGDIT